MKLEILTHIAKQAPDALIASGCNEIAKSIKAKMVRYGNPNAIEVDVLELGVAGLEVIYTLAKADGDRSLMMQITSYRNIIEHASSALAKPQVHPIP